MLSHNVARLPEGLSRSSPEAHTPVISPLLDDDDVVVVRQEDFGFHTDLRRQDVEHPYLSEPLRAPVVDNPVDREEAGIADGLDILPRLPIGELAEAGEPLSDHDALGAELVRASG